MLAVKDLFQNYKIVTHTNKRRSERGDLINLFLETLNPPRIEHGLKLLNPAFLSMKFSSIKLSTPDMYRFYKDCQRSNNFSRYFWWSMKPR